MDLQELKQDLLKDGIIDADEVKRVESQIFADGKIDREEADFLFEVNDAVSGRDNDIAWSKLFVKAITSYLLDDEKSPGVIDSEEVEWLLEKLNKDGQIDDLEKDLLLNLKSKIKILPEKLAALL